MTKDAPAFEISAVLETAIRLANEHGCKVCVSKSGNITVTPLTERKTSSDRVRAFREKKRGNAGNSETHETHETHETAKRVSPSPSLSSSPQVSPKPPSSPTPTLPSTPVREEAAAGASGELFEAEAKPKAEKDPRFVPFRNAFVSAFEDATGCAYPFKVQDGTQLSMLLKKVSPDSLTLENWTAGLAWCRRKAADQYSPSWLKTAPASLASFASQWSKIVELGSRE